METSLRLPLFLIQKSTRVGLILLFFLISCTELVGFQLDKALMVLLVGVLLFHFFYQKNQVPTKAFAVLVLTFLLAFASYLLNLPESSLIVFFPLIGLTFVTLLGEESDFLEIIYWGIFFHILLGVFFVFSSYLIGMNRFVHPMYDKGLPFLHAAKGLTTTVQAFGTLIISWFLIYYFKKAKAQLSAWDRMAYLVVLLGLILTFNRNSFLIFYILLFFQHKRFFWLTVIAGIAFYLYFFEFINKLIFNVSTLNSRADLLQAFRIAFFEQTDWMGYLIGHGNNIVGEAIAKNTIYNTGYIENGTSVLLYTYGFIGYFLYLVSVVTFAFMFFRKRNFFFASMFFYIFIIAQQFTHEFYSTTIYLLISVFLLIYNQLPGFGQKDPILSPAE
ncbi:hypothetical protein DFQ04_1460 [Algoriphagus boseongensis]|uniref:O-antigen ligase-like membrane protein n=1 Tax=Algoriphagus boseongensis TaxID=1442587 RepID=A0A4R6TA49_9BACT|nr:hypothetical protein [Algoriphagus boseongensis]TDQ19636.1 hypothetical protein DFQ04_1460 [Algoriphagus boseongensis]